MPEKQNGGNRDEVLLKGRKLSIFMMPKTLMPSGDFVATLLLHLCKGLFPKKVTPETQGRLDPEATG